MTNSVEEYLSNAGAIELLCSINPEGSRFEELLEEVSISRGTLSDRLGEAKEVGLLETEAITGERGTTHTHKFTHTGAMLWYKMNTLGVSESFTMYKNARLRFEDKSEQLQEWVKRNEDELEDSHIGMSKLFRAVHLDDNPLPDWDSPNE